MAMTISRFGQFLRRPTPVLLALLLLVTTGGFRPMEWTLCVEPDGRVHTESVAGDCAGEERAHAAPTPADGLAYGTAPAPDADCGDCVDITGRSHGLRLREETTVPVVQVPLITPDRLPALGPARGPARPAAPDLPCASALTDRATGTTVLTC